MNCIEFNELLFSYIDGELDASDKKLFEEHMKTCVACEKEYQAYKKLINDVHTLPMEELPKGYCKRLHVKLEDAQKNKVRRKRNNLIKYVSIAASCVLVFSAIYFTNNNLNNYTQNKSLDDSAVGDNYSNNLNNKDTASVMPEESNENTTQIATRSKTFSDISMENKIIKSGNLNLQTLNFDEFMNELDQIVRDKNGYFEFNETSISHKTEDKEYKNAIVKLRVPQEAFYEVVDFIESKTDVYNRSVNENDVTKEYYDIQNVLTNLQVQENRLRELYDKAANITEILALENEITRIRTEIDSYSINLSDIDDRVNMATIDINVTEIEGRNINIPSSKGLWSKSKEGFIRTINNIINCIEGIIVWTISYLPILIPIVIIGFVLYRVIKKKIQK